MTEAPKAPVPPVYAHLPQWVFGFSKQEADALCALVLDGKKIATSEALYHYDDIPVPEPGDRTVLLDGEGRARCVIETVSAEVLPFDEIDGKIAIDEGETSLAAWRKNREAAFTNEGYFAPDMLMVSEYFRVIERLEYRRVAK